MNKLILAAAILTLSACQVAEAPADKSVPEGVELRSDVVALCPETLTAGLRCMGPMPSLGDALREELLCTSGDLSALSAQLRSAINTEIGYFEDSMGFAQPRVLVSQVRVANDDPKFDSFRDGMRLVSGVSIVILDTTRVSFDVNCEGRE